MKVQIQKIHIGNRFRKEFEETAMARLAKDIKENGLLHPIVIDNNHNLICGERRLRAHILNREALIECTIRNDLEPLQAKIMELTENVARDNFTWWEECLGITELHNLLQKKHGAAVRGREGGWGLEETGIKIGKSNATVCRAIETTHYLNLYPQAITECKSQAAAVKYFKEHHGRKLSQEKARRSTQEGAKSLGTALTEGDNPKPIMVHGDSTEWLPKHITEPIVSLLLIDPPYGIEAHKRTTVAKSHAKHYDDSGGLNWKINITKLLKACYDVTIDGAHGYIFFGMVGEEEDKSPRGLHQDWIKILSKSEWNFDPLPLIWPKGNAGSAGRDFSRNFIPSYEPLLFVWKGKSRPFNADYRHNINMLPVFKTLHGKKKIHPAHKPPELYEHLIKVSGIPGGVMLDPCAGSGESGIAAARHGITPILIEMGEDEYNTMVNYVNKEVEK